MYECYIFHEGVFHFQRRYEKPKDAQRFMVELGEMDRTTIDEIGTYLSRRKGLLIGFDFEKHLSDAQINTLYNIVCCVAERNKLNLL